MTFQQVLASAYIYSVCLIVAEEMAKRIQTRTGIGHLATFGVFIIILIFGTGQMRVFRNTKKDVV